MLPNTKDFIYISAFAIQMSIFKFVENLLFNNLALKKSSAKCSYFSKKASFQKYNLKLSS